MRMPSLPECSDNPTSLKEEIANAVTHGIGALTAIAGLVVLIVLTDVGREPGYLIYAITLVLLYLASTLYHSITHAKAKNIFRKLDHIAIFLLIAGTYTPYCLHVLSGWERWTLLGIIWGCACAGISVKCFYTGQFEWLSLIFYVAMGWMALFVIKPIYESLSLTGFLFLMLGGLAYTIGTYFYMNSRIRFGHSIWHVWVMAGSTFHFFSIMTLV
jgi:hemolysin III